MAEWLNWTEWSSGFPYFCQFKSDFGNKEMETHFSILDCKIPWMEDGWRSLVGYSPWGHKESDMIEQLHFHFGNKEFMIWATVSSWSCFCWLYRASPSLAANIIHLISVLTIWWCLCVECSLVLLEEGFSMTSAFSWQNSISLCPASFCMPKPNLPVTPGVSWLPTFAFQSPIMKRTSFLGVSSQRSYRSL